jgi:molybdenum cofactor cytidylyltransferase
MNGRPLLLAQIEALSEAGVSEVIVVLGFHAEKYEKLLAEFNNKAIKIHKAYNPRPEQGSFSSLQTGISAINENSKQGIFILPLDVPSPDKETWLSLTKQLHPPVKAVIPAYKGKKGHPVLLERNWAKALQELEPEAENSRLDRQLSALLSNECKVVEVTDQKVTLNLNTPSDLKSVSQN